MSETGPLKIVHKDEKQKESVVRILRELLTEAEAGKIETVHCAVFMKDMDEVRFVSSFTESLTHRIGALFRLMCSMHG